MAGPRQVEVFVGACPLCEPAIDLVKGLADRSWEMLVRNMNDPEVAKRARSLGVGAIPAVVIDGRLAECCANRGIDAEVLRVAGLGDDRREAPRFAVEGRAVWTAGRVEGTGRLLNISAAGVQISDPEPPLRVGSHLSATLLIGDVRLESIPVEVVRGSESRLGLRFESVSDEIRSQLQLLVVLQRLRQD